MDIYENLGQAVLGTAIADVLTLAGTARAVVSTIAVCNQGTAVATFHLAHAIAGATDHPKQYLYSGGTINPSDTAALTLGATLGTADVMRAKASVGGSAVSINFYGCRLPA